MVFADETGEGAILETDFNGVSGRVAEKTRFVDESNDGNHWYLLVDLSDS